MRSGWMLAACLLFAAPSALAQRSERADALFHEARKLAVSGDYAHACPKFEESERLDPAPGTLLNLADCEERLGHVAAAAEHYRLAASGFPKADERRAYCAKKASALDARVGHLTVRLAPSAPADATVRAGDKVFLPAELGQPIAVDPGATSLVVSARGRADRTYPLVVNDGASVEVAVDAGPPLATPPVIVAPKAHASLLVPVGIVVGAVGVVMLGVGAATGAMAIDRASTVKSHCNTTTDVCDDVGLAAAHDGAVLAPLATALVVVGGVLAAAGAVLFVVGRASRPSVRAAFVPGGVLVLGEF